MSEENLKTTEIYTQDSTSFSEDFYAPAAGPSAIKRAADEAEAIAEKYESIKLKEKKAKAKSKTPIILACVFSFLTLLIAGYLLGVHYNLFPDVLAKHMNSVFPGADIIPDRYTDETYELLYSPELPPEYTELMLRQKVNGFPEEFVAYAFTNEEGEIEYRGYVKRTSVTYDLVREEVSKTKTEHNGRPIKRIKDETKQEEICVYADKSDTKVESGFVKLELTEQQPEGSERFYEYKIVPSEGLIDPSQEKLGKCEIQSMPAGYEPAGANGIEAVKGYTSLYKVPVSLYSDNSGKFTTYYVYYVYGGFGGKNMGFYPAHTDGSIIAGGIRNENLSIEQIKDGE